MDDVEVKLEHLDTSNPRHSKTLHDGASIHASEVIDLRSSSTSSSSDSDCEGLKDIIDSIIGGKRTSVVVNGDEEANLLSKRRKLDEEEKAGAVVPVGFLDPLSPVNESPAIIPPPPHTVASEKNAAAVSNGANYNKQFWKAGDYEGAEDWDPTSSSVGMDRVRVHPKFLHSNATSHKWALGAFAELLDNALDEVYTGATYANIDMLKNEKDGNLMLLIEDNGGGMDPDKMRQCMSLGYSVKSKIANTIGQYGNGFKTSTMRLGADVLVFSRCHNKGEKSPTQSIGLLSYTFLRSTAKEDIVVPMLDYEKKKGEWKKMLRSSPGDWNKNVATIVQWSPFTNETDLLGQFNMMKDHGTRIVIYNLWEDDQGMLELDFENDKNDIMLRGVNRDEKNIQMASQFPNSRHFLTYKHSLRSYASILYLRLAPGFRIILRGKDVEHHNIVNDMMLSQEVTYRPQPGSEGVPKDMNMLATVTIGFVKDAKHHIDVQGFNVYHKNRLIKPFWRIWNVTGSDGRGVIGVLEANFVEPAHDKQGFERTTVLSRLEAKLIQMQKNYWNTYCHKIGYAARRNKREINASYEETSMGKSCKSSDDKHGYRPVSSKKNNGLKSSETRSSLSDAWSPSSQDNNDEEVRVYHPQRQMNGAKQNGTKTTRPPSNLESSKACQDGQSGGMHIRAWSSSQSKDDVFNRSTHSIDQLREENSELRERLMGKEDELKDILFAIQREREGCNALETQIHLAEQKIEEMNMEQESLMDIFSEERSRRDVEEENLRKKLKDASNTIQELLDKVRR